MADIFQTFSNAFYLLESNWQYVTIGSDNGLMLIRQWAIIWSNDDPVRYCIYTSPELKELIL